MTNKELIIKLLHLPLDAEVVLFQVTEDYVDLNNTLEDVELETNEHGIPVIVLA